MSRVQNIPSPAGPGSMSPHLALTPSGSVVMSWLEPTGEKTHALKFATLDGDQWSPTRRVAESAGWFVNWADFPSVTPITTKDWVAHRLVKQPGGTYSYDLALAISRDGGVTWGAPFTPHTDGTRTEHGFATLFPWGDGFGAVWLDGRNTQQDTGKGPRDEGVGGMTVRFARIGFDGKTRESGEIDKLACDCCATDVAMATAGPVATWRDRTPDEIRDIAVSRYADGKWQPPVIVGNDGWQIAGCPVNGSTIAARGQRVAVAWYTAPNRQARVQLAWSTDGGRTLRGARAGRGGRRERARGRGAARRRLGPRDLDGQVGQRRRPASPAAHPGSGRPRPGAGHRRGRRLPQCGISPDDQRPRQAGIRLDPAGGAVPGAHGVGAAAEALTPSGGLPGPPPAVSPGPGAWRARPCRVTRGG